MKHHALLAVIVAGSSLPILGGCSAQPQHQVRLIEPEFSYRQAELRGEPVEVMAARGPAAPTGMASRREASAPFTRVP